MPLTKKGTRTALLAATVILLLFIRGTAAAESLRQTYTEDRPLIYEDAWDLWPYSFMDSNGKPTGFNIDLIRTMMKKLDIPYEIRLKHTSNVYDDLKTGRADLTMGMYAPYHNDYGKYSSSVVCIFTHSVATAKGRPLDIEDFKDLRKYKVLVHENSFSHHEMTVNGMGSNAIPYDDMKEAVFHVSSSDSGAVLWNTMSLKWLINKYHLDNIKLSPVNMPHGEYHFITNDTVLLAKLDSVFTAMVVDEEIQPIRNKWFYPEYRDSGIPLYAWHLLGGLAALLLAIFTTNIFFHYREKRTRKTLVDQNERLMLYLQSGKMSLWTYDIPSTNFVTICPTPDAANVNAMGLSVIYHIDDFKRISQLIGQIKDGEKESETIVVRGHVNSGSEQERYFKLNISVLSRQHGKPTVLLGTQRDITTEYTSRKKSERQQLKYYTLFNSSMVDMAYFDRNGVLLNINEKACQTLKISNVREMLRARLQINDIIPLNGIDVTRDDVQWSSSINDLDKLRAEGKIVYIRRHGMLYYQSTVIPIYNKHGELDCLYCIGHDITDMVNTIQKEKRQARRIEEGTKDIRSYVESISYMLEESDINISSYDPGNKLLTITHNMNQPSQVLSQMRCLRLTAHEDWGRAVSVLDSMDRRRNRSQSIEVKTNLRNRQGLYQYLAFNAIPITDRRKGTVDHYFGLCRDVTVTKETDRKLRLETRKAQEAETVKSAFLKNMSHEIRTPLNAVIGFAKLFDTEHATEDEAVFVNEIKKNTDILLKLVNDILLLSRLDARMVEFKKTPTNIAAAFTSHCQMGLSVCSSNKVKINIEVPDSSLKLDIDNEHMGFVIRHICENAARFTKQGHINAKCTYHTGHLVFNIDDTGTGISRSMQPHVFDRFVHETGRQMPGSGLGLPICKEMVEQMGGHINLDSVPGQGTSVWVSIPCDIATAASAPAEPNVQL